MCVWRLKEGAKSCQEEGPTGHNRLLEPLGDGGHPGMSRGGFAGGTGQVRMASRPEGFQVHQLDDESGAGYWGG